MNKRTIAAFGIAVGVLFMVVGCIFLGNIHPIASFTVDKTSGDSPLDVDFDASDSSDADGTITTYFWNFGDGQSASKTVGTVFTYTFTNVQSGSQIYRVVLTVTDNLGAEDEMFKDITVNL